jgi:uncharacterized protein YpiB (UPF0302 family)
MKAQNFALKDQEIRLLLNFICSKDSCQASILLIPHGQNCAMTIGCSMRMNGSLFG